MTPRRPLTPSGPEAAPRARAANTIAPSSHKRRNELDEETADASIEYLVYGKSKCGVTEHDIGYWDTRWWPLGQLLEQEQVNKSDITAAVEAWQEAEEAARESLFALAAAAAPAEA